MCSLPTSPPAHTVSPSLPMVVLPPALKGPGATRVIRFSPDGSATGGAVVLGGGTHRIGITVEWLTGRVTMADAH